MKTAMAASFQAIAFGALGFLMTSLFSLAARAHVDRLAAECKKASAAQVAEVNRGNARKDEFLAACAEATGGSGWCPQLIKPSPSGLEAFRCTYGPSQVYRFVHPDEETWEHAFKAVRMIQTLQQEKVRVCEIYYWWRPEPFNTNAGGAPTRHPFGTSVDVRFCSMADMEKAHKRLCEWRAEGELRAVGYYGSRELHFGIADRIGNTWGKDCPGRL